MILVTGGAGYIGSHTCVELLASGQSLLVLDNLCNAQPESLARVAQIANVPLGSDRLQFVRGDVRDAALLQQLFAQHPLQAVVHFAGLKAVGESVAQPLQYYSNNVQGTLALLQAMAQHGCRQLVFSSSATVYGNPATVPIPEHAPLSATNPYGQSKLVVEHMLRDLAASDPSWRIAILRYFNPVGAYPSGHIGEDPRGIPNNLLPYIAQVAVGKLPHLAVFGNDYPTLDGTGVRDYIHVVDLAQGHLCALRALSSLIAPPGAHVYNLGTGQGYSVLQMVRAFEAASGRPVPFEFAPRRPGDIATCYADPAKAKAELGWQAQLGLDAMMRDAWRWVQQNPNGYKAPVA
jgi:UDP-glucose 4-epimerase